MYRALVDFSDMQDNSYSYKAGDVFPRKGFVVKQERIKELLSSENKLGKPVIEEIKAEKPKEEPKVEPKAAEPKVEKPKAEPKKRTKKNAD